jgi:hypothetical protein
MAYTYHHPVDLSSFPHSNGKRGLGDIHEVAKATKERLVEMGL